VTRRLPLRVRLLAGLLLVTTVGLIITGLVSTFVLRAYLMERLDAQLAVGARRAAFRMPGVPHRPVKQAMAPSRYVVELYDPASGKRRHLDGSGPQVKTADHALRRLTTAALRRHAASGEPFVLNPKTGKSLRAAAHDTRSGRIVVVAATMDDIGAATHQLILTEIGAGVGLILVIAAGGRWLIIRGLAPLRRMATTAQRVSGGSEASERMPEADDDTETGRLASAINTMLERIDRSFAAQLESERRVRVFAADASHELRTPLTTIRGYAELGRQGAISAEELPAALGRIESEAARMSRLVAELLELARLDRRTALEMAETDLTTVAREAAADAGTVEPDRPITVSATGPVTAVVDEPRLRQVLANLLTNVRVHTPPGTPVTIRLARSGQTVLLEVHDSGPGMDAPLAARAFDRFSRGTDDRLDRISDGSGLGLAIVQAIVASHNGSVTLESVPGAGTTIRVTLPTRPLHADTPSTETG